jgi:hypothetical protein
MCHHTSEDGGSELLRNVFKNLPDYMASNNLHTLRVFENRVIRRIFGPKKEEEKVM